MQKNKLLGELETTLTSKICKESDEKYILMCMKTLKNYDDKYGMFLACAVNRVFYYDVARLILEYI